MINRRGDLGNFYRQRNASAPIGLAEVFQRNLRYTFHGEWVGHATVVRADINGYSKWARDHDVRDRVTLLDEFFTFVVPELERHGGIFFRDEGDCIVGLFSTYFGSFDPQTILAFCKSVANRTYGVAGLTAKVSVAHDVNLAFFQKAHEAGTQDWSSEGEGFVRAARLEQAIESKARIYFFANEYRILFEPNAPVAPVGGTYFWAVEFQKLQVPGLSLPGGGPSLSI